jgi:selenocysteine lyase/cysteine desulfurase
MKNTSYLIDKIKSMDNKYALYTAQNPDRHAGIVSFRPLQEEVADLHKRLQSQNVVCAVRGGALRLSPHFYTPPRQLDQVLALL